MDQSFDKQKIADKIYTLRNSLEKPTYKEMAKRTGVSDDFIRNIEIGKKNPSLSTLSKIADGFHINIDDILDSNLNYFNQNPDYLMDETLNVLINAFDNETLIKMNKICDSILAIG